MLRKSLKNCCWKKRTQAMCQFHTLPHQRYCQINVQNHLQAVCQASNFWPRLVVSNLALNLVTRLDPTGVALLIVCVIIFYFCYNIICMSVFM